MVVYLLAFLIKVLFLSGEAVDDGGEDRCVCFDSCACFVAHRGHAGVHVR